MAYKERDVTSMLYIPLHSIYHITWTNDDGSKNGLHGIAKVKQEKLKSLENHHHTNSTKNALQ